MKTKRLTLESFQSLVKKIIKEEIQKQNYHETLSQALDVVRDKAASMGFEVDEDDIFRHFGTGGIRYEETKSANINLFKDGKPIMDRRGREMNRSLHVSIYRMPSGRYELTMYPTF